MRTRSATKKSASFAVVGLEDEWQPAKRLAQLRPGFCVGAGLLRVAGRSRSDAHQLDGRSLGAQEREKECQHPAEFSWPPVATRTMAPASSNAGYPQAISHFHIRFPSETGRDVSVFRQWCQRFYGLSSPQPKRKRPK